MFVNGSKRLTNANCLQDSIMPDLIKMPRNNFYNLSKLRFV